MKKITQSFFKTQFNSTAKIVTVIFIFLVATNISFAQLLQWNTFVNTGTETTEPSVFNNANISASNLSRNGLTSASNQNRFGGSGWFDAGNANPSTLANAIAGNNYIEFTVTPNAGTSFTATSLVFKWDRSGTGPQNVALRSSADSFANNLGAPITAIAGGSFVNNTITITTLNNITVSTTFRMYGYGATAAGGTGGFDNDANSITVSLNGTTSLTIWNGTIWTNGTPTATVDAIIDATYNTNAGAPQVPFSCKKLTINSGKSLTINSGNNVTVNSDFINNGTLNVENNANLIQTAVTNTNSGSGTATVNRNSNSLKRLDYTLWSSPVSGTQTLADFSPLTSQSPNRFFNFNPNSGASGAYANVPPTTTTFAPATGYLIRMPNENPNELGLTSQYYLGNANINYNGIFTGTPNNGTYSTTTVAGKYYAVGNPYPSTISADSFITANGLTEALYFWRKTNNLNQNTAPTTSYATYTLAGGAGTNANGGITPNGTIQVGQGFIAKAFNTSLAFTNAMRTGNNANQILKIKQTVERNRVWLNLTNADGVYSQTMLAYMTGATDAIDPAIDGRFFDDSKTALNSLVNNEEFVIQGRGLPFDSSDVVALAFKNVTKGTLNIAIDHVDGFFAQNQDVYLVDNLTATETNLKETSYTFNAEAGVDNARFSLRFQKTLKVDENLATENGVLVYQNNGSILINSKNNPIETVEVFDIQGKLIAKQNEVKSNTTSVQNLKNTNQVLILKVTTKDGKTVSKKLIN